MILSNYHTHSLFCDGKASPAQMAFAAREAGFSVLGFSGHAPLPFPTDWNMKREDMGAYRQAVSECAREHQGAMEVLLGWEIDWIEGLAGPSRAEWATEEKDFCIGSVHYLRAPDGFLFTVDEGNESFRAALSEHFDGNGRALVEAYWSAVAGMVRAGGFDILGHLDLVRKNNVVDPFFAEDAPWYIEAAFSVIDLIAEAGVVVEINMGGMARGKISSPYPAPPLLSRLREKGVPMTLCSDAHAPEHLTSHQESGRRALLAAGFDRAWYLSKGEWKTTEIKN